MSLASAVVPALRVVRDDEDEELTMGDVADILKALDDVKTSQIELRSEVKASLDHTNLKIDSASRGLKSLRSEFDMKLAAMSGRVDSAHDLASEARKAQSEVDTKLEDNLAAMKRHAATVAHNSTAIEKTATALVTSNQTQNVELAQQTAMLSNIEIRLAQLRPLVRPVILEAGKYLGFLLAAIVTSYLAARAGH